MERRRISIFESFLSGGRVGRRALNVQKAELKACVGDIFESNQHNTEID